MSFGASWKLSVFFFGLAISRKHVDTSGYLHPLGSGSILCNGSSNLKALNVSFIVDYSVLSGAKEI